MAKTYHICSKELLHAHKHLFCPRYGAHYIDLPTGDVLVCANFSSDSSEEQWSNVRGVENLPHPTYEGQEPIAARHHKQLKHLGIDPTHTVVDVARIAGKVHPLLRLIRFPRP